MECGGANAKAMDSLHKSGISDQLEGERQAHLEYLADLLGELQRMAEREGCRKLSHLLAISYAEAVRETHRHSA